MKFNLHSRCGNSINSALASYGCLFKETRPHPISLVGAIASFVFFCAAVSCVAAEGTKKPFSSDLGSPDVVEDFVQPAHKLDLEAGAGRIVSETQVFRRAQLLKITRNTAASAWKASPKLVESLRHERKTLLVQRWPTKTFTGTKISELSEFLAGKSSIRVVVMAPMLDLDQPLIIRGSNLILDLSRVSIKPKGKAPAFAVRTNPPIAWETACARRSTGT